MVVLYYSPKPLSDTKKERKKKKILIQKRKKKKSNQQWTLEKSNLYIQGAPPRQSHVKSLCDGTLQLHSLQDQDYVSHKPWYWSFVSCLYHKRLATAGGRWTQVNWMAGR